MRSEDREDGLVMATAPGVIRARCGLKRISLNATSRASVEVREDGVYASLDEP